MCLAKQANEKRNRKKTLLKQETNKIVCTKGSGQQQQYTEEEKHRARARAKAKKKETNKLKRLKINEVKHSL